MSEQEQEQRLSHAAWVAATRAEIDRLNDEIKELTVSLNAQIVPLQERRDQLAELVKNEPKPGRPPGSRNKPKEPEPPKDPEGQPTAEEQAALAKLNKEVIEA